ncbi:MAG TPA: Flp pilus assembly protein CpaB [Bryobacteraceae bacterium]|nr:Flp pilus assembly protein CpaB [Bryobacteraceae bacterium]
MKRNIVPLLGIAVVVAILSTGVFYGLFAGKLRSASAETAGQPIVVATHDLERGKVLEAGDLKVAQFKGGLAGSFASPEQLVGASLIAAAKQNEPLLEERVVTRTPGSGSSHGAVPPGERVVSIRVSESEGVVGLLRPGSRVDVQAVQDRQTGSELRTILQNIEVVSVNSQGGGGNRGPVAALTVLVKPDEADVLAVADSGARLRVSLRNPLDEQTGPRRSVSVGSVFQAAAVEAPRTFAGFAPAGSARVDAAPLHVDLMVLRASAAAASQLESKLEHAASPDSTAVTAFTAGVDAREMIEKLAGQQEVAVLAERSFSASGSHPAWFRTGPAAGQLGLELFPEAQPGGRVNLKIREEVVSQTAAGAETRRYESGVPASGNFLLRGILSDARDRETLERMFPGKSWSDGRLLILVVSREADGLTARHDRGR